MYIPLLKNQIIRVATDQLSQCAETFRQIIGVRHFRKRFPSDFIRAVTQNLTKRAVDIQVTAVRRGNGHTNRRMFKDPAEAFFALPQGSFCSAAIGDVPHHSKGQIALSHS